MKGFAPRQNILLKVACVVHASFVNGFLEGPQTMRGVITQRKRGVFDLDQKPKRATLHISRSTALPFEENDSGSSSSSWMDALRLRQLEIGREKEEHEQRWRDGECSSAIKVSLSAWVRRLDVEYPLVACGSASGKISVAHLESGSILAESPVTAEIDLVEELEDTEYTLEKLYGKHDGSDTISIAFKGDLICEANRKGGVQLWGLDGASRRLISQGRMKALEGVLVTCLHLDGEYLWVGTEDGHLKAFLLDSHLPLALQTVPDLSWKVRSTITSLSLCPDINCGVISISDGSIELISTEDDNGSLFSFSPSMDDSSHTSSTILIAHNYENKDGLAQYSIVIGGNDGSMFMQKLNMNEDGEVDDLRPFDGHIQRLNPPHLGAVKCLASPIPGILVSGGSDGSVRVWDVDGDSCLYQFVGYKEWMGSLWTDGWRIVSDGSDNTVIVHDYQKPSNEI